MDLNQRYAKLAAQLGDIDYKLYTLGEQRLEILRQLRALDELAGMLKQGEGLKYEQKAENVDSPRGPSST